MFAQVEDLTGAVEVTVFPRTYEATAPLWNADEILLVLARVEQRDEDPKLLCEHAVRFDDAGIQEIRRVADERRQYLAKRARFSRPTNGNGNGSGGAGASGKPAPAREIVAVPEEPREEAAPDLIIRFREVLDYKDSIALFQKIQVVLADHAGPSLVVVELPRNGGGMRRVHTSFRARPSRELADAVAREVGGDVVEVVLPR